MQIDFEKIREWGKIRGIKSNLEAQIKKLDEEVQELKDAKTDDEFKDAIGDIVIVLTGLAEIKGVKIEDCIELAFSEIQYRKGLTKDGLFIKYKNLSPEDQDLCDKKQGSLCVPYFKPRLLENLKPNTFLDV